MILTQVIVDVFQDGRRVERRTVTLPSDNPGGFHGNLELTLHGGCLRGASIQRESLHIGTGT